jgi:hypothetical protein
MRCCHGNEFFDQDTWLDARKRTSFSYILVYFGSELEQYICAVGPVFVAHEDPTSHCFDHREEGVGKALSDRLPAERRPDPRCPSPQRELPRQGDSLCCVGRA